MNCVPHKYYYSDQVQEGMMGAACGRNREEENYVRDCGGETLQSRIRLENLNIDGEILWN